MNSEELRRAIAEKLGWREIEAYEYWYEDDVTEGFRNDLRGTSPTGSEEQRLPDWPNVLGEALWLCLDVARTRGWELVIDPSGLTSAKFINCDEVTVHIEYPGTVNVSETLARLAYKALEARELR